MERDLQQRLHGAKLVGVGVGSTASGGATANITVDARGGITGVTIVNGGGAYGIGNSVQVVGVTTSSGHVVGVLTVTMFMMRLIKLYKSLVFDLTQT